MMTTHKTTRTCITVLGMLFLFVGLAAQDIKMVPGNFSTALYRPADGKLYVGHYEDPSPGFPNGKSYFAIVDPRFARVEQRFAISSPVATMALTQDQAFIYFATYDSVFRYNINTGGIDLRFAPQVGTPGTNYFTDLTTVPGNPNLVIVSWSLNFGSAENALVLYSNGVRKPDVVQDFYNFQSLAMADDGVHLYTYNRSTSASQFTRLLLTPTGLQALPEEFHYMREFSKFVRYFDNRLYGSEGTVAEIQPDNQLRLVARLTRVNDQNSISTIVPRTPVGDTIFMHSSIGSVVYLQMFNHDNFQLLGTRKLGTMLDQSTIKQTVALGNPGSVAVLSELNTLCIIQDCISQITTVENFPKAIQYACLGDTLKLTAPGNFPTSQYFWSDGHQGKIYPRYTIDVNTLIISYSVADANGCLGPTSEPIEIKTVIRPVLPETGTINSNVICAGGFVEMTATSPGNQNLRGFEVFWSDGQTGERIRVEVPGSYTARVMSPEGCLSLYPQWPTIVTSSPSPQPPQPAITIEAGNGDEIICSTEPGQLKAPAGYPFYYWSDGLIEEVNTRNLPSSGEISVVVANAEGCRSDAAVPLNIQRFNTPAKPKIVRAESVLGSSAILGNQWFLDGLAIPGATAQFLTVTQPGNYSVQVTLNAGCPSSMSEPFAF